MPYDADGDAILRETVELAQYYGAQLRTVLRESPSPEKCILDELRRQPYGLIAMGVTPRTGESVAFGASATAVLAKAPCSVALICTS